MTEKENLHTNPAKCRLVTVRQQPEDRTTKTREQALWVFCGLNSKSRASD